MKAAMICVAVLSLLAVLAAACAPVLDDVSAFVRDQARTR